MLCVVREVRYRVRHTTEGQATTESLEVWHVCVITLVVGRVFRLDICMLDTGRSIPVEIYIVVFPIHPSANSPVAMSSSSSSSSTSPVECNVSGCRRVGTTQCYNCKGLDIWSSWCCDDHINTIRYADGFYPICDYCRRRFVESDTEPDTPQKVLPPPDKRRRSQEAPSE